MELVTALSNLTAIEGVILVGASVFAAAIWGYIGHLRGVEKGYHLGESHGTVIGFAKGKKEGFGLAVAQFAKQLGKTTKGQSLKNGNTKSELIKDIRTMLGDDWRDGGVLVVSLPDKHIMVFDGTFPQGDSITT